MAGIEYLDFEVEVAPGADGTYRVRVLQSPTRFADAEMILPFERQSLDARLRAVQARLLLGNPSAARARLPTPAAAPATDAEVRLLGEQLFDAMFRDGVRAELAASQKAAEDQHRGLRIKLQLRAPELAALPWELLFDPDHGDYLALAASTPLVRFVPPVDPPAPLRVRPPLRILGVVASPTGLRQLNVERERQRLELALDALRGRGRVELEWLGGQSARFLQAALRQGPWHILHFIGHGGFDPRRGEGFIVLAGDEGEPQVLDATNLARLAADHDPLRLVVLNACDGARGNEVDLFSSTAALVVQKGTPAVVAMQFEITDDAAIEFSRSFYEAIADGAAIDTALGEARKGMAVNLAGTLEWATPVLYTHAADGVLFTVSRPRRRAAATPAFDGRPVLLFDPADEPAATTLAAALERQELPTVRAPRDGAAPKVLDAAACLLLLGPASTPVWSEPELHDALALRAHDPRFPIAPVLLPGSALPDLGRLPDFLAGREWIDLRAGVDVGMRLDRLVEVLGRVEASPAKAVVPSDVAPFRGLEVFDEQHADVFFGREALTQQLIEHLRSDRFLAVVGPSGSGKSSVVRAGLIAEIRRGALPDSAAWPVVVMKPGSHPLDALAGRLAALTTAEPTDEQRETALTNLLQGSSGLGSAVTEALAAGPADRRVLIVVDQFEEVFTLAHDEAERQRFVTSLIEASRAPGGRAVVVITMRADFIGHAAAIPALASTLAEHDVLVSPMTREELRRAIVEPAARAGLQYESGVVDTIMAEVGGESGALPLLEDMLLELWEGRSGGWLTMARYREIGGVRGAIAKRADATYEQLTPSQQSIARRILLRLVTLGTGSQVTRRRAAVAELKPGETDPEAPDVDAVLQALVGARLITTSREDGKDVIDVAHEALINNWPRLRGWIEDGRAALRVHRRIADAAAEWEAGGRDPSYLLRGTRLTEGASFADQNPRDLNDLERVFVTTSIDAGRAEQEARRRGFRRRIYIAAAVMLALVGLTGAAGKFGIDANTERDRANEARDDANKAKDDANTARDTAQQASRIAEARAAAANGVALSVTKPNEGLGAALDGWVLARRAGIPTADFRAPVETMLAAGRIARIGEDVERLIPSPDGKYVVLDAANGPGSLVRMSDGATIATLSGNVAGVAFGPAGAGVAGFEYPDGERELRRLDTGAIVPLPGAAAAFSFPMDPAGEVLIVTFGPDDDPATPVAETRSLTDGALVRELADPYTSVDVLPGDGGGQALAVRRGGRYDLLRMTDSSTIASFDGGIAEHPDMGPPTVLMFSGNDGGEGSIGCRVRRASDGAVLSSNPRSVNRDATQDVCGLLATSPDGSLAAVSSGNRIRIVRVATPDQVLASIPNAGVIYVAIAPGPRPGFLAFKVNGVDIWRPGDRAPVGTMRGPVFNEYAASPGVAFSPDGRYATFLLEKRRMVNMTTGKEFFLPDGSTDISSVPDQVRRVEFGVGTKGPVGWFAHSDGSGELVLLDEATRDEWGVFSLGTVVRFWPGTAADRPAIVSGTPFEDHTWDEFGLPIIETGSEYSNVVFSPGDDPAAAVVQYPKPIDEGVDVGEPSLLVARDRTIVELPGQTTTVTFSPDPAASRIVLGFANGTSELWDRASASRIGPLGLGLGSAVFDGAGDRVAVRYLTGETWLIDVARLQSMPRDLAGLKEGVLQTLGCDTLGRRAVELAPVACGQGGS